MSVKMVLFDLDGTLLPMGQERFAKGYLDALADSLAKHGYEPNLLVKTIWAGMSAMVKNDGRKTNEDVFWERASEIQGKDIRKDEPLFEQFYRLEFDKVKASCGYAPQAAETVRKIKEMGYRVALATNPVFPAIATQKRIAWTGLCKDDFELVTTYENSRHCKPNTAYYEDVLAALGVRAEDCLMVGNDVEEDMVAQELGMQVFLLTDCIINRSGKDISAYPNGSFSELIEFIQNIS